MGRGMEDFRRYAIYYVPRPGEMAEAAAAWLGWDLAQGRAVAPPLLAGLPGPLADLTAAARPYGFHGTLKAPFRLASGQSARGLNLATARLAETLAPVTLPRLQLAELGGFLALIPDGDAKALLGLGAEVVSQLDRFRAPLSAAEIARRRPERLSPRQRDLLDTWGYPHVMEAFRFHLTLTGDLEADARAAVMRVLESWLVPILPAPFVIEDICLAGEDAAGRFHLLARHALTG